MDAKNYELERAFKHLEDYMAGGGSECSKTTRCEYHEGDLLLDLSPPAPPCTAECSYKQLHPPHIDSDVFIFVCKEHHRVHRCGVDCAFKELSHEAYTCPKTSMVIPMSLVDDDQANGGVRRPAAEGKKNISGGDEQSEKCRAKHIKNSEAISEALELCSESFSNAGVCKEKFSKACEGYLNFLYKNAKGVSKNISTKRSVSHFALAMAFMHRTGYTTQGLTLFRKYPKLGTTMPKSHCLNKHKYKMRAITRIQDSIRGHVRKLVYEKDPNLERYTFPPTT